MAENKKIEWFFSSKGERAYTDANTYFDKFQFIYEYLCALTKQNELLMEEQAIQYTTYVIVECAMCKEFSFSRYPDILQKEKNPFIYGIFELNCLEWEHLGFYFRRVVHDMISDDKQQSNYYYASPVKVMKFEGEKLEQEEYDPLYRKMFFEKDGGVSEYIVLDRMLIWLLEKENINYDNPYKITNYVLNTDSLLEDE